MNNNYDHYYEDERSARKQERRNLYQKAKRQNSDKGKSGHKRNKPFRGTKVWS